VTQVVRRVISDVSRYYKSCIRNNSSHNENQSTTALLLYPARTRWGTYLGYCSRRDGARNSG